MKKIVLLCAGGMSTSILARKMKKAGEAMHYDVDVHAYMIEEAAKVGKDADVILIGPQIRYLLVLRPADAEETTVAWKLAMENVNTPTGLILSRQNVQNLPEGTDYTKVERGAYVVAGSDENPDVILVASGSEVSTLVAGAELLRKDGVRVRIVSAPSEGLFRSQDKAYQESVLPTGAKIFGLTAGLPFNLAGLVGCNGKVFGLESFGFSAPYKVLDEKLGFTAENVYNQVKEMLS